MRICFITRGNLQNDVHGVNTGISMPLPLPSNSLPSWSGGSELFRRRLRTVKMLEAVCLAGIAVILSYALLYLSDRLWETPPAVGWLLFFIAVSGLAVFIPWWSFRWVWQRRTEAQLARLISRTDAALGDRLLGVIELDSEKHGRQYGSES